MKPGIFFYLGKTQSSDRVAFDAFCRDSLVKIADKAGHGKSVYVAAYIIRYNLLMQDNVQIYIIDPKNSNTLSRFRADERVHYHNLTTDEDCLKTEEDMNKLRQNIAVVQQNLGRHTSLKSWLSKNPPNELMQPRILIVDEAHTITAEKKPTTQLGRTKLAITEAVKYFIEQGRSAGMCTVVVTFSPIKDAVNIPHEAGETMICGRITDDKLVQNHGAGMKHLLSDPRLAETTFFALVKGGDAITFRVPIVDDLK